jgi:hypothetical protein
VSPRDDFRFSTEMRPAVDKSSYEERFHKCAHEQCECMVPPAEEYCSAYCSTADDVEEIEIQCDCGHDSCALT